MGAKFVFILGADDPEMRAMHRLLLERRERVVFATFEGRRCNPETAYRADPVVVVDTEVVLVECQPGGVEAVHRIDHHRPGDPGYDLGPEDFWRASSIGQLHELLGIEDVSREALVLAAMDHCPAAAFRGECEGVTPEDVFRMKVREIAAGTGFSPRVVKRRIAEASALLRDAPTIRIGRQDVRDLRDFDTGEGYSLELLTAQVAVLMQGSGAALLSARDQGTGRRKWTLYGHVQPECVEAFMKGWAPAQGLTGIYGVPARGYAGGYLP